MKKKILALCVVVSMLALAIAGGTLAYFTETATEDNVFVIGNIDIELWESNGENVNNNGDQNNTDYEDWLEEQVIYPGRIVNKNVWVENVGVHEAYARVIIFVPAGLVPNWDASVGTTWIMASEKDATVDGVAGTEYVLEYNGKLAGGAKTPNCLESVTIDPFLDYDNVNGPITQDTLELTVKVTAQAIQTYGFANAKAAFTALDTQVIVNDDNTEVIKVTTKEELAEALATLDDAATAENKQVVLSLPAGNFETNIKIAGGKDVTIMGTAETVLSGQIASTASNEGTLRLVGVTINVDDTIVDSTGISQTGKSAIAIWGDQTVICEGVTFNMSKTDSSAITAWWDTGVGTTIECYNCVFNCNGQRPIRATGNVTVENCTFNDPYRYAVQLTAKTSTATEMDKAIINFNNNTIVNGQNGKAFVYGIQLEGADYGCHDCVINGSGNTIVDGGADSAMYYCECGKVVHDTIEWNVEVTPVHEN